MFLNLKMNLQSMVTHVSRLARDLWSTVEDKWENEHRKWEDII